nr:hypothetical protein [Tanacetum cinerariifolium]
MKRYEDNLTLSLQKVECSELLTSAHPLKKELGMKNLSILTLFLLLTCAIGSVSGIEEEGSNIAPCLQTIKCGVPKFCCDVVNEPCYVCKDTWDDCKRFC